MRYLLSICLILCGCGYNGNQKLETNDSRQDVIQSGESFTYIIVRLEFIQQLKDLCTDKNIPSDFETEELRTKAIAECTLDGLSIFNVSLGQVQAFSNDYCGPNPDLTELTEEQRQQAQDACQLLGSQNG